MRGTRPALVLGLLLALGMPFQGIAHAGTEEEAARQLELAEEDLATGNFERAAASAASALRLDPALQEALVTRALALKGLGRLEDAAALLRAYMDLRGTLTLDERVRPALDAIKSAEAAAAETDEPEDADAAPVPSGPLAVLFGPDSGQAASEAAYAAARPFLGDMPAASSQPLSTILPSGADALVVLGADAEGCSGVTLDGSLDEHLDASIENAFGLEAEAALAAASTAEQHLACGSGPIATPDLAMVLAARAGAHWVSGEPEMASRLWREMFSVAPSASINAEMPPAAQALQLDAKARAAEAPILGDVVFALEEGWAGWIDGVAIEDGRARVAAGRRIVRAVGPSGETLGALVTVQPDGHVVVGTPAGVTSAVYTEPPEVIVLGWLAKRLEEVAARQDAVGALVINLSTDPPTVRRFGGDSHLILTTTPGRRTRAGARGGGSGRGQPKIGSAVLLGGGLAATVAGIIVAAVSHGEGVGLQADMGTVAGFDGSYGSYEAARTRERVGVGIAIGGGVVAAVGGVTFVIPEKRASTRTAER